MKKIFSMILLAGVIAFTSCGDDDTAYGPENLVGKPAAAVITIEKANLNFQCTAGQGSVECTSTNPLTAVETNTGWCSASLSGNTVNVSVMANPELETRVSRVRIYAGDDYKDVTVQQFGTVLCINNGDDIVVNAAPQSVDLDISYTGSNELSIVDGDVDWADFTLVDNKLHVEFQVNTGENARATELTLSDGESSTIVNITQNGLYFIVNEGKDVVTNDAAYTQDLPISTVDGIGYTAEAATVDWATFSIVNGALRVKLTANNTGSPRFTKAVITYAGTLKAEVTVGQYEFKDALGDYKLIYTSSGSQVYTPITLEKNGDSYQVRFNSTSLSAMGAILPVKCDEEKYTITIGNCTDMEGTYTKSGTDYSLMSMVNYTNGSSVYRTRSTDLLLVGTFDPESAEWNFEFDPKNAVNHTTYSYYALRIAYTTGGYDGYVGAYVTFVSMSKWQKQ